MKVEFDDTRFGGPRTNTIAHAQLEFIRQNLMFGVVAPGYGHKWVGDSKTYQLSCHFHGEDRKPSARFYHDTRRMWCFACNEGGDICWYLKKKENFGSYGQVIEFVKERYGIWLDPDNLDTRIKMYTPQQVNLRDTFSEKQARLVNDSLYQIQEKLPKLRPKIENLLPLIWARKKEIDNMQNVEYVAYCNHLRNWKTWVQDLIREANKFV